MFDYFKSVSASSNRFDQKDIFYEVKKMVTFTINLRNDSTFIFLQGMWSVTSTRMERAQ